MTKKVLTSQDSYKKRETKQVNSCLKNRLKKKSSKKRAGKKFSKLFLVCHTQLCLLLQSSWPFHYDVVISSHSVEDQVNTMVSSISYCAIEGDHKAINCTVVNHIFRSFMPKKSLWCLLFMSLNHDVIFFLFEKIYMSPSEF